MMVSHGQNQRQHAPKDEQQQLALGEARRLDTGAAGGVGVAHVGHLGQDVDRGHVEEGPRREQHRKPRGVEGVQAVRAARGRQGEERQDGHGGGGHGEGHEVLLDSGPLQSLVEEEGGQPEGGGGLVQHDGQEDDNLDVGLVGGGCRPQCDPVRGRVDHQAQGRGPVDVGAAGGAVGLQVPFAA